MFYVIGIDDSEITAFNSEIEDIVNQNTIFSGGVRHYEIVKHLLPPSHRWITITPPMKELFEEYKNHPNIVAFTSGDPLFYGFVATIQRFIPNAAIKTFPFFNSLQLLAHRITLPYQDMHNVSLTGRTWRKFDESLIMGHQIIGVLTDKKEHTPTKIAQRMIEYGYDNYHIYIGELLGNRRYERVTEYSVEKLATIESEFAHPNNMILQKVSNRPRPMGVPDDQFELLNGRSKMITKAPIRLITLSELELREKSVFWDVGFCTGSISIEAVLQFPHLHVVSFEVREECEQIIATNTRRFGTPGIEVVIGDFTKCDISKYERPDSVFIGGHGGKLDSIMGMLHEVLRTEGVILFNSVSKESREMFLVAANKYNYEIIKELSITVDNYNTINIIKAKKAQL